MRKFRILSVSRDAFLQETRRLLLEREGYAVVSCCDLSETLAHCQTGDFDLVVIGHTLPIATKTAIAKAVRDGCLAPIIELSFDHETPVEGAAVVSVNPLNVPTFLATIKRLLAKGSEASA